jgi:predicted metalloprotease
MTNQIVRATAISLIATLIGLSNAATDSNSPAAYPSPSAFADAIPAPAATGEITARDIAISNQKVRSAHAALITMWSSDFGQLGQRFLGPDLVPYVGGVRTACGLMRTSNAIYCPRDNTIYFEEVFVAAQARNAAEHLGTDGDMAAVGIIAHEMGHAVAIQLRHVSRIPYENEATADCLAGAFAQQASRDGSLEDGDLDEAFYAMSTAGDPPPELTGNRRTDGWILTRAALGGHGTREQRMQNFRNGLEGGPPACLPEFRGLN